MKMAHFYRDVAGVALAFLAFQTLQIHLLREAFRRQDLALVHRLEVSVVEVLNEAHKANDDLAIYHVIHALEHSPGVLGARILKPGDTGYPLIGSAGEWGRFHLSVSDRLTRQLIRRQWMIGALALGFLWAMMSLYLYGMERQRSRLGAQRDEFQGLLEAERRQLDRSQEREQLVARQGTAALQQALQHIPEPLLILNPQQRVWAINQSAADRLHIEPMESALGKSWHEISLLESCGPALEHSIASPGHAVEHSPLKEGLRLEFNTDPHGLAGTWITSSHCALEKT